MKSLIVNTNNHFFFIFLGKLKPRFCSCGSGTALLAGIAKTAFLMRIVRFRTRKNRISCDSCDSRFFGILRIHAVPGSKNRVLEPHGFAKKSGFGIAGTAGIAKTAGTAMTGTAKTAKTAGIGTARTAKTAFYNFWIRWIRWNRKTRKNLESLDSLESRFQKSWNRPRLSYPQGCGL